MKKRYSESELIIRPDGGIYHLKINPSQLADQVIVVGDPERVKEVSRHFDAIEFKLSNREIHTHTGRIGSTRITVMSTGMGPDNIDIVMNELDALANIDLETRTVKTQKRSLNIIRLGTSGSLHPDIPVDTLVASTHGVGLDGLLYFYKGLEKVYDADMTKSFIAQTAWPSQLPTPYIVKGSKMLLDKIGDGFVQGMTATAPGFYGPQSRELRMPIAYPGLTDSIAAVRFGDRYITNVEMETAALYGLGALMGHQMLTVCTILANRALRTYSSDPSKAVENLIIKVLERLTN